MGTTNTAPTRDPQTIAAIDELRDATKRLADRLADIDGDAVDLTTERDLRLAAFAPARATAGETTSAADDFAFQYVALALLEPDGDRYHDENEYPALAFGAVRAIPESPR